MAGLNLKNLHKSFGAVEVIKGVDLQIEHGEFVVFVGPSGCGKSTLLRMIAGLEEITKGELYIGDALCNYVEPRDRGIAMVFQSYALYPHMSVYDNIGFGLKLARAPKEERDRKVREAARMLQLESLLDRKPGQLSGGQRQRVAIGRAIVRQPEVFLFDEPLSNLDAALRVSMRQELTKLHHDLDATMIYVTHDQVEAMTMADKIVVLNGGVVQQVGSPIELYQDPANLFVAGFIGSPKMNFIGVTAKSVDDGKVLVKSEVIGDFTLSTAKKDLPAESKMTLGVRPHELTQDAGGSLSGTVELVERLGNETVVNFNLSDGTPWMAVLDGDAQLDLGSLVSFNADPGTLMLFAEDGERVH